MDAGPARRFANLLAEVVAEGRLGRRLLGASRVVRRTLEMARRRRTASAAGRGPDPNPIAVDLPGQGGLARIGS